MVATAMTSLAPAPTKPGSISQGQSRSALLVHGLCLLFLAAAWILMDVLGESTEEGEAVQGVGGAAALVLALWSGVLSVRALVAGERPGWPVAILALGLVEASLPCLFIWWPLMISYDPNSPVLDLAVALGLPIVVPFLAFATFLGVPLAWWLTRRAEKKCVAKGAPAWERRRRWKRGAAWYAAVFVALSVLVLPYPLYLFCVGSLKGRWYENKDLSNWRRTAIAYMPDYVKSSVDSWVEKIPGKSVLYLRQKIIHAGKLPKNRILANLQDADSGIVHEAWRELERECPQDALEYADEIASGQIPANKELELFAGMNLGAKGSAERVRTLFHSRQISTNMLQGLIYGLRNEKRIEFQPEIIELFWRPKPIADIAWEATYPLVNTPQQKQLLVEKILNDPDLEHRSVLADYLPSIRSPELRDAMLFGLLKDRAAAIRRKAMLAAVQLRLLLNRIKDLEERFNAIEHLSTLLAGQDLILRRGAVALLAKFLELRTPNSPSAFDCVPGQPTTDKGGAPAAETPAELQELETLRAALQAWLEKNREVDPQHESFSR